MNEIAERLAKRLFDTPIIQNQFRSTFVEAMLEPVLEETGWKYTGDGWSGWDFERADGARLEVKTISRNSNLVCGSEHRHERCL